MTECSRGPVVLRRFLESDMAMSHVYQPLMIRTILEGGGAATLRQIAAAFLAADLSQLEYYEIVVKRYPAQVLKRRGLIEHEKGVFRLAPALGRLDDWERASLIALCDAKLADFIARRQSAIWAHRDRNREPLPGTLRWQVMKRAMGRCEACGISTEERRIEADHIQPRSRGGPNDLANLQALCSLCNVQKLDGDATDFRSAHEAAHHRLAGCPLCKAEPITSGHQNLLSKAVRMNEGIAVVPLRHGAGYFDLWQAEVNAIRELELLVAADTAGEASVRSQMIGSSADDSGQLAMLIAAVAA